MVVEKASRGKTKGAPRAPEQPDEPVEQRFPDFLCIGVQKAGTTWLYRNLRRHPGIWLPPVKELQYFNALHIPHNRKWAANSRRKHGIEVLKYYLDHTTAEKRNYHYIARIAEILDGQISDDWYGRIFSLAKPEQICGEITPEYSKLPREGIEHVLRLMPKVKIILSLRDPIERNWSHIRMHAKKSGGNDLSKLEQLACTPGIMRRADYSVIIANWRALVSDDRLLITFMDDIITEPMQVLEKVCAFLGTDFSPKYFLQADNPVHVGEPMEIPPQIYALLKKQLKPAYDGIVELYPQIGEAWRSRHYV